MKTFYLVRFGRKSGKIDTTMQAYGVGLLKMWALQNTTKTKDTIIFGEDGIVVNYFEGTGDFPKISKGGEHVDTYCEGLLEAVLKA